MIDWTGFDPSTHRAYVKADGTPTIEPIADELLQIRALETFAERSRAIGNWMGTPGRMPVDAMIDLYDQPPAKTMERRRMYGLKWTQGVGQPQAMRGETQFLELAPPGCILIPPEM